MHHTFWSDASTKLPKSLQPQPPRAPGTPRGSVASAAAAAPKGGSGGGGGGGGAGGGDGGEAAEARVAFRYQWQLSFHFARGSVVEIARTELQVVDCP